MRSFGIILFSLMLLVNFSSAVQAQGDLQITDEASVSRVDYIDFGSVRIRDIAYRSLRLTNSGDTLISDLSLRISGYEFDGRTNCTQVLAAGESCTVSLEFQPWSMGSFTGGLHIDATGVSKLIRLYGWGVQDR